MRVRGDFRARDKKGNVVYNKDGTPKQLSSARFYAWFVWEKDSYDKIEVKFINTEGIE